MKRNEISVEMYLDKFAKAWTVVISCRFRIAKRF